MKSLAEVAADLNAIKTERSHTRVVVPDHVQNEDNFKLLAELLDGTEIDQSELAGLSLAVGSSALQSLNAVDGGIDGMELIGLIGSLWVDGVILGTRYMAELYASDNGTPESEATEGEAGPVPPDPSREAANDDPRGERDR